MDSEPIGVFVVTLQGVERPGGPGLTVLAFARAEDVDAAEAVATDALAGLGWEDIQVLRCGEIVDSAAVPEDFRGALETALAHGCGLIVYEKP